MKIRLSGLFILYFIILVALCSCTNNLSPKEYVNWVKDYDNGLHVKKVYGDYLLDLQYQPIEYSWLLNRRNLKVDKLPDLSSDSLVDMQYFQLTVSVNQRDIDFIDYNVQNDNQRQQKLYYFSYELENDIQLQVGDTILPCVISHFEKPIDVKYSREFILGFENPAKNWHEATLVIHSRYLGALPVKIRIEKNNIPELKI